MLLGIDVGVCVKQNAKLALLGPHAPLQKYTKVLLLQICTLTHGLEVLRLCDGDSTVWDESADNGTHGPVSVGASVEADHGDMPNQHFSVGRCTLPRQHFAPGTHNDCTASREPRMLCTTPSVHERRTPSVHEQRAMSATDPWWSNGGAVERGRGDEGAWARGGSALQRGRGPQSDSAERDAAVVDFQLDGPIVTGGCLSGLLRSGALENLLLNASNLE